MLGGVVYGHEQMQSAIQAIHELEEVAGKPAWEWQAPPKNEALIARVAELTEKDMREAFAVKQKQARTTRGSTRSARRRWKSWWPSPLRSTPTW